MSQDPHEHLKESPSVYKELRKQDSSRDEHYKPDTECKHLFWIKRCSLCREVIESDSQINHTPGKSMRTSYNDLEILVCTFALSIKLQEMKVLQKSKLYWVHMLEPDIISLKSKGNVTLRGSRVASAFTSGELCRLLYRLPRAALTPKTFEYVGRYSYDPNRIARLYLKLRKQYTKS